MAKRELTEINAGSMADIAFLLLIFFLFTTTMDTDLGLVRKLPPWNDEPEQTDTEKIKKRNILVVLVNRYDQLLVGGEVSKVEDLRERTKEFLTNPLNKDDLPEKKQLSELRDKAAASGKDKLATKFQKALKDVGDMGISKGVVSLQNDRSTTYKTYVEVQNELVAAFNELRNELSRRVYKSDYDELTKEEQGVIKTVYPLAISEAEPKNVR